MQRLPRRNEQRLPAGSIETDVGRTFGHLDRLDTTPAGFIDQDGTRSDVEIAFLVQGDAVQPRLGKHPLVGERTILADRRRLGGRCRRRSSRLARTLLARRSLASLA